MPPRKPRPRVSLEDFLHGLVAVLSLKGRPRFRAEKGVLDAALAGTVTDCAKALHRVRVDLDFRLRPDSLSAKESQLRRALMEMEDEGILRSPSEGENEYEILLGQREAIRILDVLDLPIPLFERAANAFRRRHEMAKLRSLVGLHSRRSTP